MPKPYPKEFRDDVVRVARSREPGQSLKQVAVDFGISESCLTNWLKQADVEDGIKPGVAADEARENRELRKRIRLLEQENEVLRRAAAYLSQASLPGSGNDAGTITAERATSGTGLPSFSGRSASTSFMRPQADDVGSRLLDGPGTSWGRPSTHPAAGSWPMSSRCSSAHPRRAASGPTSVSPSGVSE